MLSMKSGMNRHFANDTIHKSSLDPEKQAEAKNKEPMEKQENELSGFVM